MKKIVNNILVLSALMLSAMANAQEVSPVDFMRMNPYQMKANPATDLPYKSVLSLAIGNYDITVQNTTLRYDNLFDFDAQGRPATVNLRQLANSLKERNFVGINANVGFFTLYRRLEKGMLTIDYSLKSQTDVRFNDGLFKLLGYGNSAYVGDDNPAIINLDVNAMAYQELAVGYQSNVTENLSVGGRGKLLFGAGNVKTDAFDVRLFTDPDSYALRLKENIALQASLPNAFYVDEQGNLKTDGPFKVGELYRNVGFAVDLAAEYHFDEHFSAVAAVHDLGFIHWGMNNIKMTGNIGDAGQFYDDGDFLFNGLDVDQLQLITSDDAYRELFLDTLKQYFQVEFAKARPYNTMLNTNLLLRGNYDLDANNRFSAQVQGKFYGSGFRPAFTVAYSGSFWRMLDVCATYTMMKGSFDNIGLGLAGNFGTLHIYLTTSNILGLFKPLNASVTNVQAGIVFNLRLPEKRYIDDSEMPEYLE